MSLFDLTKHKGQAIAVVDAPAEDAIGHAPVRGCEDLGNEGPAYRPEGERVVRSWSRVEKAVLLDSPADGESHGDEHPEDDELPVAGAEPHEQAGQGEGQAARGQHHRPRQPLVQEVGQDGQEHRREDEDQDERRARQHLKWGGN